MHEVLSECSFLYLCQDGTPHRTIVHGRQGYRQPTPETVRTSFGICLRPIGLRSLEISFRYNRKPAQCYRTPASGVATINDCFHPDQHLRAKTKNSLRNIPTQIIKPYLEHFLLVVFHRCEFDSRAHIRRGISPRARGCDGLFDLRNLQFYIRFRRQWTWRVNAALTRLKSVIHAQVGMPARSSTTCEAAITINGWLPAERNSFVNEG